MNKPAPKTEMVVTKLDFTGSRHIHLYYITDDARSWIQTNADEFGILTEEEWHKCFALSVHPAYDIDEVLAFLQSGYSASSAEN